jgi:hypothetical protein
MRFEILMAVSIKTAVWDVTPSSLVIVANVLLSDILGTIYQTTQLHVSDDCTLTEDGSCTLQMHF